MSESKLIQVVVAYDFSPSAAEALGRAVDVAARAPQHVLHLVAALNPNFTGLLHVDSSDDPDRVRELLLAEVTAAFAGRSKAAEIQFFVHTRIGKPAEQILEVAAGVSADLIFIGSHGHRGLERLLLGSVSEQVVREARCPVMVVRAKGYEPVDLAKVIRYDHDRPNYDPPHRYTIVDTTHVSMSPFDRPGN